MNTPSGLLRWILWFLLLRLSYIPSHSTCINPFFQCQHFPHYSKIFISQALKLQHYRHPSSDVYSQNLRPRLLKDPLTRLLSISHLEIRRRKKPPPETASESKPRRLRRPLKLPSLRFPKVRTITCRLNRRLHLREYPIATSEPLLPFSKHINKETSTYATRSKELYVLLASPRLRINNPALNNLSRKFPPKAGLLFGYSRDKDECTKEED